MPFYGRPRWRLRVDWLQQHIQNYSSRGVGQDPSWTNPRHPAREKISSGNCADYSMRPEDIDRLVASGTLPGWLRIAANAFNQGQGALQHACDMDRLAAARSATDAGTSAIRHEQRFLGRRADGWKERESAMRFDVSMVSAW